MPLNLRERQVQAAACRVGLKLIADRYDATPTGRERYYLRPIWDARQVVRVLPDGSYELVQITGRRRYVASPLPLDDVELLLSRWNEPAGADQHHVWMRRRSPHKHDPRTRGKGATPPTVTRRMVGLLNFVGQRRRADLEWRGASTTQLIA